MKNLFSVFVCLFSLTAMSNHHEVSLSYSSDQFSEDLRNDGSIANSIIVKLSGDRFLGRPGEDMVRSGRVSIANYPQGLSVIVKKLSKSRVKISLEGTAAYHYSAGDVSNLVVSFSSSAFKYSDVLDVENSLNDKLQVNFID